MNINNILKYCSQIGLFIEDNNGNILVKKEHMKKIKTEVYNVPVICVNGNKKDIFKIIKSEFENIQVKSFIDEIKYLDELCNEKIQINLFCKVCGEYRINLKDYIWVKPEEFNVNVEVPEYLITSVAIYKYNNERMIE